MKNFLKEFKKLNLIEKILLVIIIFLSIVSLFLLSLIRFFHVLPGALDICLYMFATIFALWSILAVIDTKDVKYFWLLILSFQFIMLAALR